MKRTVFDAFENWPKNFIRDSDLVWLLGKTADARYSLVKRALKSGFLICLRKGLYLIASKIKYTLPDEFELAVLIYEPSIVSLESALSYYGWIPETVYTTTCVSPRRAQEFKTPFGMFSYKRVPAQDFYLGVSRIESQSGVILIADPWKALADFLYTKRRPWKHLSDLEADLRIDSDVIKKSDMRLLEELSTSYPSPRVRKTLRNFLREMIKN